MPYPKKFRSNAMLLGVVFVVIVGHISTALANGGGYTQGILSTGAFKPFGIEQVEMLTERLEIDLHIEYADVRIEYVLFNPGPKVTIEAGFPSAVQNSQWGMYSLVKIPFESRMKLEGFQLAADGIPVEVSVVPDDLQLRGTGGLNSTNIKAWHIFKLDFKKGQSRRVTVTYRQPYSSDVTAISSRRTRSAPTFSYVFSSASAWKGPIKQGTVVIRPVTADARHIELSHPNRYRKEEATWVWRFSDWEPTLDDDLVIIISPALEIPGSDVLEDPGLRDSDIPGHYVGFGNRNQGAAGRWEFHSHHFAAAATSTLPPEASQNYSASNLTDFSKETCWVEGASGPGIGESVTLTLPKPAKISKVGLVNGYAKDQQLYEANNRVAQLSVSINGGEPFSITVPDERLTTEHFYFDLPEPAVPVKIIKLTIAEVCKGSQHDDTCLSDIVLVTPLTKAPKISPVR